MFSLLAALTNSGFVADHRSAFLASTFGSLKRAIGAIVVDKRIWLSFAVFLFSLNDMIVILSELFVSAGRDCDRLVALIVDPASCDFLAVVIPKYATNKNPDMPIILIDKPGFNLRDGGAGTDRGEKNSTR